MKSTLFTITKIFLLLLNSCSAPEVENETTSTNNASTILTNKTFDFSTYRQVK
jgi:hypothetical protein